MMLLGFISGVLAVLAVSGIYLELQERREAQNNRMKYASQIRKVRTLRKKGMTIREISRRTWIPKSTVHRYLND
jgi:DNA invertase Pin-like site-specific DNA recombinase